MSTGAKESFKYISFTMGHIDTEEEKSFVGLVARNIETAKVNENILKEKEDKPVSGLQSHKVKQEIWT